MIWQFFSFKTLSDQSLHDWQELNERYLESHPGLDGQFMGLLLQYFGEGNELIALARVNNQLVAAAIIQKVSWGVWTLFMPGQACLSPLLFGRDTDGSELVNSLQQAIPGSCWLLRIPRIDPLFQPIAAEVANSRLNTAEYGTTLAISLLDDFSNYWAARSKHLRQNIRRIKRNLETSGIHASLSSIRTPEQIAEGVRIHATIESSGWKGQSGSAIGTDNLQGHFYSDLFQSFSSRHQAITFQLNFDGETVASLLCVASGNMMIVLKTTYREQFSDYSPGRLIDYLSLEELMLSSDHNVIEMYTRATSSDLSWGTDKRVIIDAEVFRYQWIKLLASIVRKLRKAVNIRTTN